MANISTYVLLTLGRLCPGLLNELTGQILVAMVRVLGCLEDHVPTSRLAYDPNASCQFPTIMEIYCEGSLSNKHVHNQIKYLIKWTGWPKEVAAWELEEHLAALEDYLARKVKRPTMSTGYSVSPRPYEALWFLQETVPHSITSFNLVGLIDSLYMESSTK